MDECQPGLKLFSPEHVFIPEDHSRFFLEERSAEGAGRSYFSTTTPCIVIKARPLGPLIWALRNAKISEGSIVTHDESGYHLHILEMKSKLTQAEWTKALLQFEGMHVTSLAVAKLLGIDRFASIKCYIAFKVDAMGADKSADPVLLKTFVGMPNPVSGSDSWISEQAHLPITGIASIVKAQRNDDNDAEFGLIN